MRRNRSELAPGRKSPRCHVNIPLVILENSSSWRVTVYLNSTRKGCTIVDQLRKQRRPRVSQSVTAGRHWRGKYCFASGGEQIIGGY